MSGSLRNDWTNVSTPWPARAGTELTGQLRSTVPQTQAALQGNHAVLRPGDIQGQDTDSTPRPQSQICI